MEQVFIRPHQNADYIIRYKDIFQANNTQDAVGKNPCVLFSVHNATEFMKGNDINKKNWDKSFVEIKRICQQMPEFCNDMQEPDPVINYVGRHTQTQQIQKPETKQCKQIADFLKILDEHFNNKVVYERCGIVFLVGTFASAILMDNKNRLIHIRDSHIKDQYTVDSTGDLYKHLLLNTYIVNIDKIPDQLPKILCAIYKSTSTIDREKLVIQMTDDELIKKMYTTFSTVENDMTLIVNAVYNNDNEPLKRRIENYLRTNDISYKYNEAFYSKFMEYAKKSLNFGGGGKKENYKEKYLKYKKKYLFLKINHN